MKLTTPAFACALLLLASPHFTRAVEPQAPNLLPIGTIAPEFSAVRSDNSLVKLSDFRGHPGLIDFWATWCEPCRIAMPRVEALHQKLKDQGLIFLGLCVWNDRPSFDVWLAHPKVPTSYLKVFDPAGKAPGISANTFKTRGLPAFYLIGSDGTILYAALGSTPKHEAALRAALIKAGFEL